MRAFLAVGVCLAMSVLGEGAENAIVARFVGSWSLVSYELRLASGEVLRPFGDRPVGRILYQKSGQMSAQLMNAGAVPFASTDPLKATQEESDRAWRNYIGYWGRFSVDEKARVVTHTIEGGWFPNWIGHRQIRSFRLCSEGSAKKEGGMIDLSLFR